MTCYLFWVAAPLTRQPKIPPHPQPCELAFLMVATRKRNFIIFILHLILKLLISALIFILSSTSLQALRAWILEFEMSVHRLFEFDPFWTKKNFCRKTDRRTETCTDIEAQIVVKIELVENGFFWSKIALIAKILFFWATELKFTSMERTF